MPSLAGNHESDGATLEVSEALASASRIASRRFTGFIPNVLDLFFRMVFTGGVHPTEGVLMRRMRTGRDAAPAGSASSAGLPGASGDTARPNYMGPSGNGLVGANERG